MHDNNNQLNLLNHYFHWALGALGALAFLAPEAAFPFDAAAAFAFAAFLSYFLRTITLNLSKSVREALLALLACLFAKEVSSYFLVRSNLAILFLLWR